MDHKYDEMVMGMENGEGTDESDEVIAENDQRVMENKSGEKRDKMVVAQRDKMVMAQRDKMVMAQRDEMVVMQRDEMVVVESNESAEENESKESGKKNVLMESSQNQAKGNLMGCLHQYGAVFAPETQSQGELPEGEVSCFPVHLLP
jgi:hypothetical protein